jgi:UDP-N-acetylmuramate--alanine ligase
MRRKGSWMYVTSLLLEKALYKKIQHIHFVGIGGIGMSGIAEVLLNLGYRVSGSDLKETEITKRLKGLGASLSFGHNPENLKDADVVVISSAVRFDNPEVKAAQERNIPVIPRAEMLAELMRLKYGIAVAGAHGKTTTTSLVATVLAKGGIDPTVVIGGKLNAIGSNAILGSGEFMVAEADESDGSFLKLSPTIAIVTNIDAEHLDHYRDLEEIKEAFLTFINKIPFYGLAIVCLDDVHIQDLIPRVNKRFITYGLSAQADLRALGLTHEGMNVRFTVLQRDKNLGTIELRIPGRHNVYNALAAVACGLELEIPFSKIRQALGEFGGVQRRFQIRGEVNGVLVVDDYGHHPTEIKATLSAARQVWNRRLIVVFQPHRYTRTQYLFKEFLTAFYQADILILTEIYPAGEDPIAGISAKKLYKGIKEHGHKQVLFVPDREEILGHLHSLLKPGDVVLIMGAGDIWQVGEELLKRER